MEWMSESGLQFKLSVVRMVVEQTNPSIYTSKLFLDLRR